jgi:nucleotide-binding universal stress UspA family protein
MLWRLAPVTGRTRSIFKEAAVIEFARILAPVDLSELSVRALAHAGAIAAWYEADLTVLHVVPTFEAMEVQEGGLFAPVRVVYPVPRDQVLEQLRKALTVVSIPAGKVTLAAEAGEPAATIVDQAVATAADLVVMGTHGRSGFDRLLLGSVAEKVLRKAPCPVLTVPPNAPSSPPPAVAFRQILCPMDFSSAAMQAFGFALDLARRSNASVTLVHALEWLPEEEPLELAHYTVPEYRQAMARTARERLQALVARESGTGPDPAIVVVPGHAHREILRVAGERAADLIVMGAQGRGGPVTASFGSTTQQVVRQAPCPVLTVRGPLASSQ